MRKIILSILSLFLLAVNAEAKVKGEAVEYKENGVTLKGFIAWDDAVTEKRPGILVVHEWWGINDQIRNRAKQLAELGYVAFALDMYGEGEATDHPKKASEMMEHLQKNEELLLSRANAGLEILKKNEMVDTSKLAAIGYCFGGYVVLKMAYSGVDLKSLVTFHGSLPVPEDTSKIKPEILICHGREDTFIPEKNVKGIKEAFDKNGIKYKFISYADAVHGFTVPDADKRGINGIGYNEKADKESWQEMQDWFKMSFEK